MGLYYKSLTAHMRNFRKNNKEQELVDRKHNLDLKDLLNKEQNYITGVQNQVKRNALIKEIEGNKSRTIATQYAPRVRHKNIETTPEAIYMLPPKKNRGRPKKLIKLAEFKEYNKELPIEAASGLRISKKNINTLI